MMIHHCSLTLLYDTRQAAHRIGRQLAIELFDLNCLSIAR